MYNISCKLFLFRFDEITSWKSALNSKIFNFTLFLFHFQILPSGWVVEPFGGETGDEDWALVWYVVQVSVL